MCGSAGAEHTGGRELNVCEEVKHGAGRLGLQVGEECETWGLNSHFRLWPCPTGSQGSALSRSGHGQI